MPFPHNMENREQIFDFKKYVRPIMTTVIKPSIEVNEDRQKELDDIFDNSNHLYSYSMTVVTP